MSVVGKQFGVILKVSQASFITYCIGHWTIDMFHRIKPMVMFGFQSMKLVANANILYTYWVSQKSKISSKLT